MKKGMGKRIISLGAAFCLCAGLCACSGSGASTFLLEEAESSPAPEEEGELRYEGDPPGLADGAYRAVDLRRGQPPGAPLLR